MQNIFHLAFEDEWDEARQKGEYIWSTREQTIADVGYLHASFADQTLGVAQRFYSDVDAALVLLTLDCEVLTQRGFEVRVEPAVADDPESEQFPHVYGGAIPVDAVVSVEPYTVPGS